MTKYIFIKINKVCLPFSNEMQPFVCKKSAQYNITKPNSNKNKKSKYKRSELRGIVKGGFPSQPMLKTCGKQKAGTLLYVPATTPYYLRYIYLAFRDYNLCIKSGDY